MAITQNRAGKLITTPHKPTKTFPKLSEAWRLPQLVSIADSYLTLSLVTLDHTGRRGLRIVNAGALPLDGSDVSWSLGVSWWQGAEPAQKSWKFEPLILQAGNIEHTLEAMPRATYAVFLQAEQAGRILAYPQATIQTPDDAVILDLESILSDDTLSRAEKPYFRLLRQSLTSAHTALLGAAEAWRPAIDPERSAAVTADAALTTYLAGLSPAWDLMTSDTPLGAGGGAMMRQKFSDVTSSHQTLQRKIDEFAKANLDDIYADDKLTPPEKREVKAQYDQIKIEQTRPGTGLDALASAYGVSAVAYDSSIAALETHLATLAGWSNASKDWLSYATTQELGSGGGAVLRTKLADILRARVDIEKAIQDARDASITGGIETGIPSVNGLPALPHSAYPAGKIVWDLVTTRLYRSTGNTWEDPTTQADAIIGQLTAGQIAANTINTSALNFDTLTSGSYTESSGTPTNGFKFDSYNNILKLGPNGLNINGYIINRDTIKRNRITNGSFRSGPLGWAEYGALTNWTYRHMREFSPIGTTTDGCFTPIQDYADCPYGLTFVASKVSGGTTSTSILQELEVPKNPEGSIPRLKFYWRNNVTAGTTGSITVKIVKPTNGAGDVVYANSFSGAIGWNIQDIDLSSIVTNAGMYLMRINLSLSVTAGNYSNIQLEGLQLVI